MAFGSYLRRYGLSVFFPTVVAVSIFTDFQHTRRWKQHKQLKLNPKEEALQY
jgi:hypothetical protein